MCGIAGVVRPGGKADESLVRSMAQRLVHRGPDDGGTWADGAVGLGNRRLAVLDLSPLGHQPMRTPDGRFTLTYNGEVYNFRELRAELEAAGRTFRSQSDSEVVLQALAAWGEAALPRLNGMFALAFHDAQDGTLLLARDRFGVKPLYVTEAGGDTLFASEVKAFLEHPAFRVRVDPHALRDYFTFQNLLCDRTLFAGVRLLPPAHALLIDAGTGRTRERRWWDWDLRNPLDPAQVPPAAMAKEVRRLFEQAVRRQLASDVPVGSFLSGGMDSGSIVAVASRHVPALRTFTCGFDLEGVEGAEAGFDERAAARELAARLGTTHAELVLRPQDMGDVLPDLVWHLEDLRVGMCWQDWHANRLAAGSVTVCLSGAGGDELFGGYPWRYAGLEGVRDEAGFLAACLPRLQRLFPEERHHEVFAPAVLEATRGHRPRSEVERLVAGAPVRKGAWLDLALYLDFKVFLHGLLVVGDKLSSAHSLEVRVPFLDNDLVEYAARLPSSHKVGAAAAAGMAPTGGKLVLREAMAGLVPDEVRLRGKQGFSPPDAAWYRGPNLPFVRATLLGPGARSGAYFQPGVVEGVVAAHAAGTADHRLLLWSLLCFEWWCRTFLPPPQGGKEPEGAA